MKASEKEYGDLILEFLDEVTNFDSMLISFENHLKAKVDFSSGLEPMVRKDDRIEKLLGKCIDSIEMQYNELNVLDVQKIKLRSSDSLVKLEGIFEDRSFFYFPTLKEQKKKFEFDWLGAREFFRLELRKRLELLRRLISYEGEVIDSLLKVKEIKDPYIIKKSSPGHFEMQKWQAVLYGWFMCKIKRWKASSPAELERHLKNYTYSGKYDLAEPLTRVAATFSKLKFDHLDDETWFENQVLWFQKELGELSIEEKNILDELTFPSPRGLGSKSNYYF